MGPKVSRLRRVLVKLGLFAAKYQCWALNIATQLD